MILMWKHTIRLPYAQYVIHNMIIIIISILIIIIIILINVWFRADHLISSVNNCFEKYLCNQWIESNVFCYMSWIESKLNAWIEKSQQKSNYCHLFMSLWFNFDGIASGGRVWWRRLLRQVQGLRVRAVGALWEKYCSDWWLRSTGSRHMRGRRLGWRRRWAND